MRESDWPGHDSVAASASAQGHVAWEIYIETVFVLTNLCLRHLFSRRFGSAVSGEYSPETAACARSECDFIRSKYQLQPGLRSEFLKCRSTGWAAMRNCAGAVERWVRLIAAMQQFVFTAENAKQASAWSPRSCTSL
jgi:hypothetical protein